MICIEHMQILIFAVYRSLGEIQKFKMAAVTLLSRRLTSSLLVADLKGNTRTIYPLSGSYGRGCNLPSPPPPTPTYQEDEKSLV